MRVISGKAKGKRLFSVHGQTTRPTSDRVKESIFNILPPNFDGKVVLDLFAGTGNLGIEALSRGAAKAVFVESNRRALSVLEKNLGNCGFMDSGQIMASTVAKGIAALDKRGCRFDLVFIDPPYVDSMLRDSLLRVARSDILKAETLVIGEHSSSDTIERRLENITLKDQRRYGKTLISFFVAEILTSQKGREHAVANRSSFFNSYDFQLK